MLDAVRGVEHTSVRGGERVVERGFHQVFAVAVDLVDGLADVEAKVVGLDADDGAVFFMRKVDAPEAFGLAAVVHAPCC